MSEVVRRYCDRQVGFGTLNFWSFRIGAIVSSILFTWLYHNTRRCTLLAIPFHFAQL